MPPFTHGLTVQRSRAIRARSLERQEFSSCPSALISRPRSAVTAPTVSVSGTPPRRAKKFSSVVARRAASGSPFPQRRSSDRGPRVGESLGTQTDRSQAFPKQVRLRSRAEFLKVQSRGQKITAEPL